MDLLDSGFSLFLRSKPIPALPPSSWGPQRLGSLGGDGGCAKTQRPQKPGTESASRSEDVQDQAEKTSNHVVKAQEISVSFLGVP